MDGQQWEMIQGTCGTEGAEGVSTYGVAVRHPDGSAWTWSDVDTDPAVVAVLLERLRLCRPEPCHYGDMVLDFIHEVAAGEL